MVVVEKKEVVHHERGVSYRQADGQTYELNRLSAELILFFVAKQPRRITLPFSVLFRTRACLSVRSAVRKRLPPLVGPMDL